MGLIVDTNVFIDVENGRIAPAMLSHFSSNGEAYIAAVTITELLAGVHLAPTDFKKIPGIEILTP